MIEYYSSFESNGYERLVSVLGAQEFSTLFRITPEELAVRMRSLSLRRRKLSDSEVEKRYDEGFLKIHSVTRDVERFQEAEISVQKLRDEIAGIGVPGFETLLKEYLFGKNTFFYNKVVQNPHTKELKIVAYDPISHCNESWTQAWEREDLRESYRRFITRKSEEDPHYSRRLQYRDDSELELMDMLLAQGVCFMQTPSSERSPIIMSLSPAPKPSKYARDMGYASWWTKRLSHWRSYGFEMTEGGVLIHASTVFTYRNINRMRHLMKEVVHRENESAIRKLSIISDDRELLATPFVSRFEQAGRTDLVAVTEQIDTSLNSDSAWYDPLFVFSEKATRWHNAKRLTDAIVEERILGELFQKYLLEYYAVLLACKGKPDPYLLQEILIEMRDAAFELYSDAMADAVISSSTKSLDREKIKLGFIASAKIRGEGGNCPTLKKLRRVQNADDEGNTDYSDEESCLLQCRGKKLDTLLDLVVDCHWSARAEKGKVYKECPDCGWYPGKVQNFDFVKTLLEPLVLDLGSRNYEMVYVR